MVRRTGGGILGGSRWLRDEFERIDRSFQTGDVNGVRQEEGRDFRREGRTLVFQRSLAKEGRLGFWRWTSMLFGVAGTYRRNDSVDVVYERSGRREVATGLPIRPPE
jgi:hypothetical protein